jgi:hypothetical protein
VSVGKVRQKLDASEPLTLTELASLVGFNERTLMSAASRNEIPTEVKDGRRWVSAKDALAWLAPRGYRVSTAQEAQSAASNEQPDAESYIFVPVARDKTFFSPNCISGGGYTIGPKGSERKLLDFHAALDELARMATPSWRRENGAGNRGIVSGVEWHRVKRSYIDDLLAQLTGKGKGKVLEARN